jgi:hypothetical protein
MNLPKLVHTALDELRMQMLGTQVLFGFQLHAAFQERFGALSRVGRTLDAAALALVVLTIGLLIAAPSQHRLVEQGTASARIMRTANRFAEFGLATLAVAVGCTVYVVLEPYWGATAGAATGLLATLFALALWFGLGLALRGFVSAQERNKPMPRAAPTELHEKIDQMLTEARVILPGAQALFGFQFIVTLTGPFAELPHAVQATHFAALVAIGLSMMLLIAPAAVHRLTFGGMDSERMHDIGSFLVTLALVPLATGIAADVFVASFRMLGDAAMAAALAATGFSVLATLWYALPLALRASADSP